MSAPRAVLIGIGNPYRCDDGIGPAFIAEIEPVCPPGVTLLISDGEPSRLLDAWAGADLAIVVDAVLCDTPAPGRIHRSAISLHAASMPAAGPPDADRPASTHGLGIPDALRLGAALDRVPGRLVVFAVEAASIGFGAGLSPAVRAGLPELTAAVLAELRTDVTARRGP